MRARDYSRVMRGRNNLGVLFGEAGNYPETGFEELSDGAHSASRGCEVSTLRRERGQSSSNNILRAPDRFCSAEA